MVGKVKLASGGQKGSRRDQNGGGSDGSQSCGWKLLKWWSTIVKPVVVKVVIDNS